MSYIIAGSGTRKLQQASAEIKKGVLAELTEILANAKEEHGEELMVMSGMAEGFDKALALVALHLEIPLWAVIPTKSYGKWYWGSHSLTGEDRIHEFDSYIGMSTKVTYVMEDIHNVTSGLWLNGKHANFIRNDYMVEKADFFLVYDPSTPGTGNALASIKKAKKPFVLLNCKPLHVK